MSAVQQLMQRVRDIFKPYSFEDYVRDANPQTHAELEKLERNWFGYRYGLQFGARY